MRRIAQLLVLAAIVVACYALYSEGRPRHNVPTQAVASPRLSFSMAESGQTQVAPTPSLGKPDTLANGSGRLFVDVTSAGSAPVSHAVVRIEGGATATTDMNGQCQFTLGARWRGVVVVGAEGFAVWHSDKLTCEIGERVRVRARLMKGVALRVRVVDSAKVPIPRAAVEIRKSYIGDEVEGDDLQAAAQTDADGLARFVHLYSMPVTLAVQCKGYVPKRERIALPTGDDHGEYTGGARRCPRCLCSCAGFRQRRSSNWIAHWSNEVKRILASSWLLCN
jgi:hypothetical protein